VAGNQSPDRLTRPLVRQDGRLVETDWLDLDAEASEDSGPLAALRQKGSELVGRRSEPALLLLADLRRIHRMAAGVSLDWEVLAQSAQAAQDRELLALSTRCHPQTLHQLKWANAMVKELSAQAVMS
jgi:hypothetical protein